MSTSQSVHPLARSGKTVFRARAQLLGDRLDLRALGAVERLAADPLTIAAGAGGIAMLFRYGAVVMFDVAPLEESELVRQLSPLTHQPYPTPETESLDIRIDPSAREGLEGNALILSDYALDRFQLVADILSKSTVLAFHESRALQSFDLIEPFALELQRNSASRRTSRELLRQIGKSLLSQQDLVGRVEVIDKPEITWERPDLEKLYLRLEDEFEIAERDRILQRKLDLISRTAETVLQVLQSRSSHRLEWYIVILVLMETLLSIYQIFWMGRH